MKQKSQKKFLQEHEKNIEGVIQWKKIRPLLTSVKKTCDFLDLTWVYINTLNYRSILGDVLPWNKISKKQFSMNSGKYWGCDTMKKKKTFALDHEHQKGLWFIFEVRLTQFYEYAKLRIDSSTRFTMGKNLKKNLQGNAWKILRNMIHYIK